MPLIDCNFTLLPVHFSVDPAVDDTAAMSTDRRRSLSEQSDLLGQYVGMEMVRAARNTGSSSDLLEPPAEMRPRTGSWGGQGESDRLAAAAAAAAEANGNKKMKTGAKPDTMTKKLGELGRAVTKKLRPGGGRKTELADSELRLRRKASIGTATQSTRLSCLTDEMLTDHTQVDVFTRYP